MSSTAAADAQQTFEAALKRLVRDRLGHEELTQWARLSGGASQETYSLEATSANGDTTRYALRRAPGGAEVERAPGKPGLATEALLLQAARQAGIPEPEVHHVLEPEDDLGVGFVMQWLEGETLGARIARSPDWAAVRPRLARQCGEILGRIHSIDLAATGLDGLLDTMTPRQFVEQTYGNYLALDTPQPMIDYAARWLLDNLPQEPRKTLVHNDFRNGNLMIDGQGVCAVLDWEIAHIGDPVRDLGWICVNSWRFGKSELTVGGFGQLEDLLAGYEATCGIAVDSKHVEFWIVFGSFWWAIGCLGMANHFRHGPDGSVERAAIGRRTTECQIDLVGLLLPGAVELIADPLDEGGLEQLRTRLGDEMPRADELVTAASTYLRSQVMAETAGRTNFLARVTANALDVVERDLVLGPKHRELELERLRQLVTDVADTEPTSDELTTLRWRLTRALRSGDMALEAPGLAHHLRQTVANQIAIDQPRYSGLRSLLT